MSKMQVLDSLLGEYVNVNCLDRNESEFYGELIEVSALGPIVKYSDHGREFVEFIPMTNVSSISHKVISVK